MKDFLLIISVLLAVFFSIGTVHLDAALREQREKTNMVLAEKILLRMEKKDLENKFADCVDYVEDTLKNYPDLCAESSTGYERMDGIDAHYEGVKCAVESIQMICGKPENK